jgi:hypothetical protein
MMSTLASLMDLPLQELRRSTQSNSADPQSFGFCCLSLRPKLCMLLFAYMEGKEFPFVTTVQMAASSATSQGPIATPFDLKDFAHLTDSSSRVGN